MGHVTLVDINGTTTLVPYIDSLVQDCDNSIVNALELLQFCTKFGKPPLYPQLSTRLQ